MGKENNRFKKIEEQASFDIWSLAKGLARFYDKNPNLAYKAIINYLKINPKASKGRTYGDLSNRNGPPSTHASGKKEDEIRNGWYGNRTRKRKPAAPRRF